MANNESKNQMLQKCKYHIKSIIIYVAGLILGLIIYSNTNSKFNELFNTSIIIKNENFKSYLVHYIIIYLAIYLLSVLFSYSFIGNYVLYFVPLFIGIELSIKLSYYYTNYSIKGIGYCLLLIIPESCLFLTTMLLTINNGIKLSKNIIQIYKKSDTTLEINLKSYLINFIIYLFIIVLICFINSGLYCVLSSLITL